MSLEDREKGLQASELASVVGKLEAELKSNTLGPRGGTWRDGYRKGVEKSLQLLAGLVEREWDIHIESSILGGTTWTQRVRATSHQEAIDLAVAKLSVPFPALRQATWRARFEVVA